MRELEEVLNEIDGIEDSIVNFDADDELIPLEELEELYKELKEVS